MFNIRGVEIRTYDGVVKHLIVIKTYFKKINIQCSQREHSCKLDNQIVDEQELACGNRLCQVNTLKTGTGANKLPLICEVNRTPTIIILLQASRFGHMPVPNTICGRARSLII